MSWFDKKPIIALAPLADYTDSPFCRICRQVSGKDFVIFREMVSSEAIVRGNEKTLKMCEFDEIERPIVLQIFGANPATMARAAKMIVDRFKPDGIDINMGCPVPKIAGRVNAGLSAIAVAKAEAFNREAKAGAALMKDHDRAVEIVKEMKEATLGVPLSVKTRLGWSKEDEILEFASKLENAGADLLAIHGRTKVQGYSGKANWEMIGKVKKLVSIPIIANGDIKTREDLEECLEITKADGVMIGRGALGNPWVFSYLRKYEIYESTKITEKNIEIGDKIEIILKHAHLHVERYGERGIATFRKHLAWYFKGNRIGVERGIFKEIRQKMMRIRTIAELQELLRDVIV